MLSHLVAKAAASLHKRAVEVIDRGVVAVVEDSVVGLAAE